MSRVDRELGEDPVRDDDDRLECGCPSEDSCECWRWEDRDEEYL